VLTVPGTENSASWKDKDEQDSARLFFHALRNKGSEIHSDVLEALLEF
jgi:hypothetical protein